MELNNEQIHEALDFCEKEVRNGRIWVCPQFEDYCWTKFFPNSSCSEVESELKWFSDSVQGFLEREWLERHNCPRPNSNPLDAEMTVWGPEGSQSNHRLDEVKELRLKMIEWLREQYPLD